MKANLKGRGGIKGLLLLHGEKVAITVVGLLALGFVYKSLKVPRLESRYQASNLQQEINQTNLAVQESKWPDANSELAEEVRRFRPVGKNANIPVTAEDYPFAGLDPPVIAPTLVRGDPAILNAVDVRATGGSGLLAFRDERTRKEQERRRTVAEEERRKKDEQIQLQQQQQGPERRNQRGGEGPQFGMGEMDPAHPNRRAIEGATNPVGVPLQGGERIERAYWATIVAKVPIRKQLELYEDAFKEAKGYDQSRDFPRYVGYIVDRAEVVGGKMLPWERVFLYDGQRKSIDAVKPIERGVTETAVNRLIEIAKDEWAAEPVDPVAEPYKDFVLTLPLPPLVGRDWGADATHPDIPLNPPLLEEEIEPLAEESTEPAEQDGELKFYTDDPTQTGISGARPGQTPRSTYPGVGRQPWSSGAIRRMGSEGQGGGYRGGMMSGGQQTTLPRGIDFKLLRFVDFTVKPGKKYKYRVQVVLADPNYGIVKSYLAPEVLDRKVGYARKADDWSDASPTVGIPLAGTVHVAEAKLPRTDIVHNDEPTVTLWAETFDIDRKEGTALHVAKDKELHRGAVINLQEKMFYTGDGDRWRDTFDSYKLQTGVTLLDVAGADRLTKDISAPARVLLMDAAGELSIRNELDDSTTVQQLRFLFTEDKRRGRLEEGAMPGGPGGFRGGRGGRER